MASVELSPCYVSGVRADLVKSEVKITLSAKLTQELQAAVRMKLAWWSVADQPIEVTMAEVQEPLPGMESDQ